VGIRVVPYKTKIMHPATQAVGHDQGRPADSCSGSLRFVRRTPLQDSRPTDWWTTVKRLHLPSDLPLKNDNWLGDGETEVNAKQYKARMKLEEITVTPRGSFDFWHHDGGLFWGHSIQVSGNLTKGPTDADTEAARQQATSGSKCSALLY